MKMADTSLRMTTAEAAVQWLQMHLSPTAQLTMDTRQLRPGDGFLAYRVGNQKQSSDGRAYFEAARIAGAAIVLYESADGYFPQTDLPCLGIEHLNRYAGEIAAAWYGQPSRNLSIVGVTGTNGKTSCALWIAQALQHVNQRCAVIGTLGAGWPDELQATGFTTPDASQLQTHLQKFSRQGAQVVAMEVSSHALEQGRVNGTAFATAIFTNLSRDHLDYHGDMEAYQAAKRQLFFWPGLRHAVINSDDAMGQTLLHDIRQENNRSLDVLAYSINGKEVLVKCAEFDSAESHYLYADHIEITRKGTRFTVNARLFGVTHQAVVMSQVVGRFNVSNLLAVLGTLLLQGIAWPQALIAIEQLQSVPGRMQQLGGNEDTPLFIVDYAHTPDALEQALITLKPIAQARHGKLWCVFGCGGNRDTGKRPQMGRVAERFADRLVLTSDNPRDENPESIIQMIQAGLQDTQSVQAMAKREDAIAYVARHAQACDVVLVAGKGHEAWQEIAGKKYPFSDAEHVRQALANLRSNL